MLPKFNVKLVMSFGKKSLHFHSLNICITTYLMNYWIQLGGGGGGGGVMHMFNEQKFLHTPPPHWADAQADLSLHWAHSHFVGFVMRWLILENFKYLLIFRTEVCFE